MLDAAARRLRIAAYRIEAVADDPCSESVPLARHRWEHFPSIERGIISLHRLEGGEQALILPFTAGDYDAIGVDSSGKRAARVGMRARGIQRSFAGSYISTRSTLLLVPEMNAEPTRPPIT